ncbi:uncharacterized protein METZ01_LOCUS158131, partial [marine metagenome]
MKSSQRFVRHDPSGKSHPLNCDLAIFLGRKVVEGDGWMILWVAARDPYMAPTGGLKVTNRRRDGIKTVEWLTKTIQRQRLYMPLDIGRSP